MQIERGGYSKALQPTAWCIRLNTNILQGSPANYVGTEPIFVSNVELYRFKHLIINILHTIQLLLGRLGLWVRAPSGLEPFPMTLTNIWKSRIYIIFFPCSVLSKAINNQYITFRTIIYVLSMSYAPICDMDTINIYFLWDIVFPSTSIWSVESFKKTASQQSCSAS